MRNIETKTYELGEKIFCCYCDNELIQYDELDKYGGYLGGYFQCDCEKAKLEIVKEEKIKDLEMLIEKIEEQYKKLLSYDQNAINEKKYLYELQFFKEKYNITRD